MSKKNASFANLNDSAAEEDENEDLNTSQKSVKSQNFISSHLNSKTPNKSPEFSLQPQKNASSILAKKEREIHSHLQQLEKEMSENEVKFASQPILLLNIDNEGKILLNKKALHLLKRISTYVKFQYIFKIRISKGSCYQCGWSLSNWKVFSFKPFCWNTDWI